LTSKKLRKQIIDFFIKRNHFYWKDKGILPIHDESLLFVNAGIVHLKNFFLDQEKPPTKRLVSIQRCIRVNDIEKIGLTNHHHSLFEMFGFFSIGDYFKKEAITYALDLIKELNLDLEKTYYTIHPDDEESFNILKNLNVDETKIYKLKSNFWDLGSGPCGPCMEIFYDKGKKYGINEKPNLIAKEIESNRFVEILNVVFSMYNNVNGKYENLLIKKIDMGGGFERILAILNDVQSAFETDLFKYAITYFQYDGINQKDIKAIVDHLRTFYEMYDAGIRPGAKKQNYVMRMLIKRIAIKMYLTNNVLSKDVLLKVLQELIHPYHDLTKEGERNKLKMYSQSLYELINQFLYNFKNNMKDLKTIIEDKKSEVPAKKIFKLYETKGIDLQLIDEVLRRNKKFYNKKIFQKYMAEHRQKSFNKKIASGYNSSFFMTNFPPTKFLGYEKTKAKSIIINSFLDEEKVNTWIICAETPFYPTSGGQINDTGWLIFENKKKVKVIDVFRKQGIIFHKIEGLFTNLTKEKKVELIVDDYRRSLISKNHSATHLLHLYLRKYLGKETVQAGSAKTPEKLRFDFTVKNNFNKEIILKKIEASIRDDIKKNIKVKNKILSSLKQAKEENFLLTFIDEYDKYDQLRGVIIGESKELCGGIHVSSTKEIEQFKIKNFKSKGYHTYRIEAVTYDEAKRLIEKEVNHSQKLKKKKISMNEKDFQLIVNNKNNLRIYKITKNVPRSIILQYFDKHDTKISLVIYVFGLEQNRIFICNSENSDIIQKVNNLKQKELIRGGGSNTRFMGVLNCNLEILIKEFS